MGKNKIDETTMFNVRGPEVDEARKILTEVFGALDKKGYNPINQIVGYLLSGDPTYITSYGNARNLIRRVERDDLLEELVKYYLEEK